MKTSIIAITFVLVTACSSSITQPSRTGPSSSEAGTQDLSRRERLSAVEHWLYLINVNLDEEQIRQIEESEHDLVVIDFITSEKENTTYPLAEVIERFRSAAHPKIVLAYLDTGEAESYRTYWQEGWKIGDPEWIVSTDPDGWVENYPVAYWYDGWTDIWLKDGGYLDAVVEAGFDGVYLDWIEGYSDDAVKAKAEQDGVDPVEAMVEWVAAIAGHGRAYSDDFIVIGQNAAELVERSETYRNTIDAIAQEQVWFDGGADSDPPGDCPLPRTEADIDSDEYLATLDEGCLELWRQGPDSTLRFATEWYLESLDIAAGYGLPVFTADYALIGANIEEVLGESRGRGFIPFVGERELKFYIPPR